MKWLVVEEPYREPMYYPWDQNTLRVFTFDQGDILDLLASRTVFRSGTAFSLEEQEA